MSHVCLSLVCLREPGRPRLESKSTSITEPSHGIACETVLRLLPGTSAQCSDGILSMQIFMVPPGSKDICTRFLQLFSVPHACVFQVVGACSLHAAMWHRWAHPDPRTILVRYITLYDYERHMGCIVVCGRV
jgi:hypothetical protein